MKDLVPIKVRIGLKAGGQHNYPNFNVLTAVGGRDWSHYVDTEGLGWHYDKCCGHQTETADSPRGEQFGVLIVPKAFADEALIRFPNLITKLTEAELESFYDNHAHKHEPEIKIDEEALKVFEVKERFKIPLSAKEEGDKTKALNPDDDTPGLTRNKKKKWTTYKQTQGVNIVQ